MQKYNVKIFTTSPDLSPDCVMDGFALEDLLDFGENHFLDLEDDTEDLNYRLRISQIVGIEWSAILDKNEKAN